MAINNDIVWQTMHCTGVDVVDSSFPVIERINESFRFDVLE